ncbi:hypothetical protein GCM10010495_38820 [Kitasatospora herbaricolor]|uniref:WXG100-like domain-containing protein n=1 Tax=Kitasatospora herbaricolor TaxID=68217 RepID=UPI001749D7E3|nr:hypothetical protein [Kitasatospora herbaricolor]MDQ0313293.1 hypothetical protein [Kitasatospora herbaricolor]GGV19962.1 hypothetical protein GCM10010495_38820 [Kitasatospora herbaricolor]
MIELPSDLAEVLKVVQSNEHGSGIVFPNANEELLAELAAAWEAWNTAAEPAVRTIVASANRAMANMSGAAADSFEAYLRKYAGTDQSHAVTTLDAGVAMAQSLRGAEQAVTQTKSEMVRELRYAKEYMDQNPAGKHDDIAQSEGIKTAADTYNRYVGQVGTSVDSMLRESAGHIERMTGAGQIATLGSHGDGTTAPTRGTAAGASFDPSTLQRPDGVDLASYSGAVPPGGSAAEFSPFSAADGGPGGMPGTLPDGMGGVGGSGGSPYRPQLASFKPFEPPAPGGLGGFGGVSGGGSGGGIGMGGADLPVYRPNPTSLSLAGLSGSQSSFDPSGGIGGALSPWSGTGRGSSGSGPTLAGGSFGGAFGGASPFGGLGLPGGLGSGATRPSTGGSRFTPGSTTAASAGRGVTGTTGRSLGGGMPGAGGAGRGSAGGAAGGFGGGRGGGSGSVAGARAGSARSGLGVAGSGEGSTRSGLGSGAGSGRGGAGGAAGAGAGTGRSASAAGAGGAHAGGHPGGGGGRGGKGKGEGNRFVRPSRFGECGAEDEDGSALTDSGVQGQAVRHEQGDRRMEQMRRRWLDAARSDDQGAPQGTGAQHAGRPGPDGADGADTASSEQALLTQLASAVLGTAAPQADVPDTGAATTEPAGTHLASATPTATAAPQGAADTTATGDDAYLDRARAAAARRGRPDEEAPAGRAPEAGASPSTTPAAEAGRPAPLREEGGFQVPSPFLRAALSRLAATGSLEGADAARPAPAAGR